VGLSEEGVVLQVSIKQTQASWQARTGGAASGGFLGAMIGDSLGGDYQTKNILRAVGAIAGGIAGERVADQAASSDAQEIVVGIFNTATGSISRVITVIQPAPFESLSQRDKVLVVNTNGTVRVIKVGYDILTYQR
jgi:outer membrane lipoprotein SlyB